LRWLREKTTQAQEIAAEIARSGPMTQQPAIRTVICDCCSAHQIGAAEAAQREAQVLVAKEPQNWQARATLGLACFVSGGSRKHWPQSRARVTGVEPRVRSRCAQRSGGERLREGARHDARISEPNAFARGTRADRPIVAIVVGAVHLNRLGQLRSIALPLDGSKAFSTLQRILIEFCRSSFLQRFQLCQVIPSVDIPGLIRNAALTSFIASEIRPICARAAPDLLYVSAELGFIRSAV